MINFLLCALVLVSFALGFWVGFVTKQQRCHLKTIRFFLRQGLSVVEITLATGLAPSYIAVLCNTGA